MNRPQPPAATDRAHLDVVRLGEGTDERVRFWHSPDRWAQASTADLPGAGDPGTLTTLLERAGVLPPPEDPVAPRRIVLVGAGALAHALAVQLAEHLGTRLVLTAPRALDAPRSLAGDGPARWQADLVAASPAGRVALVRSDPCESWTPGTLVVVAGDTIEADRALLARLSRRGAEHVVVTSHRDRAAVGPWVHPGSPCCLSCLDHWRADLDPDYPLVLDQLCRRPASTRQPVVQWAAATLVANLLRPGVGRDALAGRVLELDLSDAGATGALLRPHPRCTCHAAGTGPEGLVPAA